jgi:predicted GH43/DUF377 family glycosyl hydrolase
LIFGITLQASIDLEKTFPSDSIIRVQKIEIPGYLDAFNAGMIPLGDHLLMSFRILPDPKNPFTSTLGVVLLDEDLKIINTPQILSFRDADDPVPPRAADARLIEVGRKIYIIYEDNTHAVVTRSGFRLHIGELILNEGAFEVVNIQRITDYPTSNPLLREKSWVPFDYLRDLYLAYSIAPHRIFSYEPNSGKCSEAAMTNPDLQWDWGILRGGTPALQLPSGDYLAFFHSVITMASVHSKDREIPHYFMGAYTFEGHPPFAIKSMSKVPLAAEGFYSGASYKGRWGSVQCVFPCGFFMKNGLIYLSYGRQDHEIWIAIIDQEKLLESLYE